MSMTPKEHANLALVQHYFAAMARGPAGVNLGKYFTEDVVQEEFPNRFLPNGTRRDLAATREAARRGQDVMSAQEFELLDAFAQGNKVAVEARWSGTLAAELRLLRSLVRNS